MRYFFILTINRHKGGKFSPLTKRDVIEIPGEVNAFEIFEVIYNLSFPNFPNYPILEYNYWEVPVSKKEEREILLNKSIDELNISVRSMNRLKKASSILTLRDLILCNQRKLLKVHKIGDLALTEIKLDLKRKGLELADD